MTIQNENVEKKETETMSFFFCVCVSSNKWNEKGILQSSCQLK